MATLRYYCVSDRGKTHDDNEDRWLIDEDAGLFVVADGMANETAPELVIQQLPGMLLPILNSGQKLDDSQLQSDIQVVLTELSQSVRTAMHAQGEIGLGTTIVLVLIRDDQALVIHAGDSRAYFLRDKTLEPVTVDHSYVQNLLQRGVISVEEARQARGNGGPTQFLGMSKDVQADFRAVDLRPNDQLLLCSDGLTEMLSDEQITSILIAQNDPEAVCRALVDAANEAGGLDNITAMSILVDGSREQNTSR